MKCNKCGTEIEEGEKFCGNCGNKIKSDFKYKNFISKYRYLIIGCIVI